MRRRHPGLPEIPALASEASERSFVVLRSANVNKIRFSEAPAGNIFEPDAVKDIASHSLKSTVLTYGIDFSFS